MDVNDIVASRVLDRIVYDVLKRRLADFDAFAREMVTWMEGEE